MSRLVINIIMLAFLAFFLIPSGTSYAQSIQMLGEAPAGGTRQKVPTTPAAQPRLKKDDAKAEEGALAETTKEDYSYYLKGGDKSEKWNQYVRPGFDAFENGNVATAGIFLQKAYDQGCRDPFVLFRLAIIKESRQQYAEAANLMMEADKGLQTRYSEHPLQKAIHKHAARALFTANKNAEALTHLNEALIYEPNDFMLLFMAGQVLHQTGESAKAILPLEKALTVPPPPEGDATEAARSLLHELIMVTYDAGDADKCSEYIKKMLALDPTDQLANKYRSKVMLLQKNKQEREIIKKLYK